jgi:putative FmdB family regulatory protein
MRYEYKCNECQTTFEIVASFDSTIGLNINCPNCKSFNINKVWFPPTVVYNGTGWGKDKKDKK